ncbi:hypothetical protein LCGC14_1619660 [marine sediment metagenome]|uniref:Uncharacterized protein n=1 Tax=marine sediment metagenome TaxID=412755 RepID=A0A0F9KLJ1_9ZZZZ
MFDLMKKLLYWFLVLSALGVMGCAHNSKSSFNMPGVADGHLNVDLVLNVPILGASGVPAATKADVDALSTKLDKLTKLVEPKKPGG